ncbi:hypothetical protein BOTBODRAFT_416592 [Botryobasidium botryosum FD-172 SS1]|uniref:Uncharacterized protein n=1 Tax=Botryobasidium botryosum (strain FD-172 SS1) TaxID=930990 RepID=A0A067MLK9_BOTB1|nr:hypothetical protein BOTBODRAFT_416592 [Botryobasidium botryosum FD-172 SS1]
MLLIAIISCIRAPTSRVTPKYPGLYECLCIRQGLCQSPTSASAFSQSAPTLCSKPANMRFDVIFSAVLSFGLLAASVQDVVVVRSISAELSAREIVAPAAHFAEERSVVTSASSPLATTSSPLTGRALRPRSTPSAPRSANADADISVILSLSPSSLLSSTSSLTRAPPSASLLMSTLVFPSSWTSASYVPFIVVV